MRLLFFLVGSIFALTCKSKVIYPHDEFPLHALFTEKTSEKNEIIKYLRVNKSEKINCQKVCKAKNLTCYGSTFTHVSMSYKKIPISLIEANILHHFKNTVDSLSIKISEKWLNIPDAFKWKLRKPNYTFPNGSQNAWVDLYKGTKRKSSIRLMVDLIPYDSLWISKDNLLRKTHISKALFYKDLRKSSKTYYREVSVENIALKRRMKQGEVLQNKHIKILPLIHKNQPIKIYSPDKKISVLGTSLSNGNKGDQIWVKHSHSLKRLKAIVLAQKEVEVIP
jgi:flagella basal body P-ring formation protein FlgA